MKKRVTLEDIGRKLGISATTVSLALRNHPRISQKTKDRISRVLEELKYEPNRVARKMGFEVDFQLIEFSPLTFSWKIAFDF